MDRSFVLLLLLVTADGSASAQKTDATKLPAFPTGPRYGAGCGFAGVDPELRTAIETLIHYQDTIGILGWLHDTTAVYQAYAAEALIRLARKGILFSSKELALVEGIKRSKRMIPVCGGCTTMPGEMGEAVRRYSARE